VKGCIKLGVDSIEKMKKLLPSLDPGFLEHSEFVDFYEFVFQFNREGTHRSLDRSLVAELMRLVLKNRVDKKKLHSVVDFLENHSNVTHITLDQWKQFLSFMNEVHDLKRDYDEDGAWPVIIDEYVDYTLSKKGETENK